MLFSRIISYLFHPVLFSTIATFLYFIILPSHISKESKRAIISIVFISTYIIPIVLIFFLKRFKLIENYYLRSISERKFPLLFMILLFTLLGKLLLETKIVNLLAFSFFGCALALLLIYLLFFARIKASLHTMGIAGLIGLICVLSHLYKQNYLPIIITLFMLFGIIATSRLKLKAHTHLEVYLGFCIGLVSQLVLYAIYLSLYNI